MNLNRVHEQSSSERSFCLNSVQVQVKIQTKGQKLRSDSDSLLNPKCQRFTRTEPLTLRFLLFELCSDELCSGSNKRKRSVRRTKAPFRFGQKLRFLCLLGRQSSPFFNKTRRCGEMVDTWLSKSHGEICVGSNPTSGTRENFFKSVDKIIQIVS